VRRSLLFTGSALAGLLVLGFSPVAQAATTDSSASTSVAASPFSVTPPGGGGGTEVYGGAFGSWVQCEAAGAFLEYGWTASDFECIDTTTGSYLLYYTPLF
jgi:hypothetical protein